MEFTHAQQKLMKTHFQEHNTQHINIHDDKECQIFMFHLEQHLGIKSIYEPLNQAENQLFYTLLSNNSPIDNYPHEMVKAFQAVFTNA